MKKPLLLLIALLLVMTAVSAGCSIGFGGVEPAEAVNNAIKKSNEATSQRTEFDLNLVVEGSLSDLDESLSGVDKIDLTFRGSVDADKIDTDTPEAQGTLAIEGFSELLEEVTGSGDLQPEEQMMLNLVSGALSDIEFVLVDETMYLKLAGTWYEAGDLSTAAELGDVDIADATENQQCFRDAMNDPARFGSEILFRDLQEAGDEQIDGTDTHHYTADVDLDKALNAVAEISRSCGEAETAGGIEGAQSQVVSMFRTLSVEMWIDNDDYFRQVTMKIELDPEALTDAAGSLDSGSGGDDAAEALDAIILNATLKFSRFNESFNISRPAGDILQLDELLGSFGGFGGSSDFEDFEDFENMEGFEDLEDLEELGGASTTGTGTSTSGFSR